MDAIRSQLEYLNYCEWRFTNKTTLHPTKSGIYSESVFIARHNFIEILAVNVTDTNMGSQYGVVLIAELHWFGMVTSWGEHKFY